jgi:cytochrome c553
MKNRLSGLSLLLLGFCHSPVWAEDLGATIFQQGIGRDGREVIASLPGQVSLQGAAVACAGCHGQQAQGSKEGFVSAPAISWQALSMRWRTRNASDRTGFDKNRFHRAITQGLAADGRALDPIMPRFSLASDEIAALAAYLQHLDQQTAPKVAPALTLLPEAGTSKLADALLANLQACQGLAPGTRLWPLEVLRYKNPADAVHQLRQRLKAGAVRFLVAPFVDGWEADYGQLANDYQLTTLLPFSRMDLADQQRVFLALSGLQAQLRVLIDTAVSRNIRRLQVLSAAGDPLAASLIESLKPYAAQQAVELQTAVAAGNRPQKKAALLMVSPLSLIAPQLDAPHVGHDSIALIPAAYFSPDLAGNLSNWLIAYPYSPQNPAEKNWQSPLQRWSQAGCKILAKAAEQPDTAWWQDSRANAEFDALIPKQAVVLAWPSR